MFKPPLDDATAAQQAVECIVTCVCRSEMEDRQVNGAMVDSWAGNEIAIAVGGRLVIFRVIEVK